MGEKTKIPNGYWLIIICLLSAIIFFSGMYLLCKYENAFDNASTIVSMLGALAILAIIIPAGIMTIFGFGAIIIAIFLAMLACVLWLVDVTSKKQ
uniref:Uncharacterized protein n=1 Tax=viral metagenome TaxID=1070528 RepID=A0A6M3IM09_9ZZZZ